MKNAPMLCDVTIKDEKTLLPQTVMILNRLNKYGVVELNGVGDAGLVTTAVMSQIRWIVNHADNGIEFLDNPHCTILIDMENINRIGIDTNENIAWPHLVTKEMVEINDVQDCFWNSENE